MEQNGRSWLCAVTSLLSAASDGMTEDPIVLQAKLDRRTDWGCRRTEAQTCTMSCSEGRAVGHYSSRDPHLVLRLWNKWNADFSISSVTGFAFPKFGVLFLRAHNSFIDPFCDWGLRYWSVHLHLIDQVWVTFRFLQSSIFFWPTHPKDLYKWIRDPDSDPGHDLLWCLKDSICWPKYATRFSTMCLGRVLFRRDDFWS